MYLPYVSVYRHMSWIFAVQSLAVVAGCVLISGVAVKGGS